MSWPVKFWTEKVLPNVPRIIQRNFWRLLFSFLFAFLLFNLVHKNVREETEYRIITINDVEISFVPETENGKPEAIMLVPLKVKPTVSVTLSVPVYDDVKSRDLYLECPVTKKQIDENAPVFLDAEKVIVPRIAESSMMGDLIDRDALPDFTVLPDNEMGCDQISILVPPVDNALGIALAFRVVQHDVFLVLGTFIAMNEGITKVAIYLDIGKLHTR